MRRSYLADRVIVFGARPGRVKKMIPINLPRPRDLSIKRDPQFLKYEDELWSFDRRRSQKDHARTIRSFTNINN